MTGKIGPRRSDATQGTEDICDVHLDRTHLMPGVKGEDWELHQHAEPAVGPARHTARGLVTYRRYVSRTHSLHLALCEFSALTYRHHLSPFPPPCSLPRIPLSLATSLSVTYHSLAIGDYRPKSGSRYFADLTDLSM